MPRISGPVGVALSGLYLSIVWTCVYHFLGNFHPLAFGLGMSICGVAVILILALTSRVLSLHTAKNDKSLSSSTELNGRQVCDTVKDLLALANRRLAESPKVSSERIR